jgi:predicted metal-binding membrane protein
LSADSALESALKRDRLIVVAAALLLAVLAWGYLIWLNARMAPAAGDMGGMDMAGMHMAGMDMSGMSMSAMTPTFTSWTAAQLQVVFAMWAVMMVGMMTPSVAPMLLIYTRFARHSAAQGHAFAPVAWFAAGYLAAWSLFAALATLAQWGLASLALLTPMMAAANRAFGGAVLIAAGIYQWLPLKDACLAQCRSPLSFVQQHGGFRTGAAASLRLGLVHGLYCIGCCWALMALLFVGGVMNLFWIATLMILVLLEKIVPYGRRFARLVGIVGVAAGVWMLAT